MITENEFKRQLIEIERRRINVTLMERNVRKAREYISDDEYQLVRQAEESGFGNKIPDLRSDISSKVNTMRRNAKIYPY